MKEILIHNDKNYDIFISDMVIANIIVETLNMFPEIGYIGGKKGINQFLKRNKSNIDKVDSNKQLIIDVKINVPFGENIPKITAKIQKKIIENFIAFLEFSTVKVDIIVDGFIEK